MRVAPLTFACVAMGLTWGAGWLLLRPMQTRAAHEKSPHDHWGRFGGLVQSVGENHVKAVFTKDGKALLYTLGKTEEEVLPIPATELHAEIAPAETLEMTPLTLKPDPFTMDPFGMTSRFVGDVPPDMAGKPLAMTLTIALDGKRYRVRFDGTVHRAEASDHGQEGMPASQVANASPEERELYLQPGGLYTKADIAANGRQVASIKFKGIAAKHNMNPEKGARLCPISGTEANPKFAWVIGGERYAFCCPPCVEEFLRQAKTKPQSIQAPEKYVKR